MEKPEEATIETFDRQELAGFKYGPVYDLVVKKEAEKRLGELGFVLKAVQEFPNRKVQIWERPGK